jgi:hypothetical protein
VQGPISWPIPYTHTHTHTHTHSSVLASSLDDRCLATDWLSPAVDFKTLPVHSPAISRYHSLAIKVRVVLRPTVNRPFCLGVTPPSGVQDQIFVTVRQLRYLNVGYPVWREDGSVVYNCCWSSPAQSFSGTSPAEFMTIFNYLRFETPPTWTARSPYLYPPGTGWPSYTLSHWVHFSLPPTTSRTTVEVFRLASTRRSLAS